MVVPQQTISVVERLGRFQRLLEPGLHFVIPIVDRVAYTWSLKEEAIPIHAQTAITRDNVAITIDGVLYIKVIDPKQASYGVEAPLYAVVQLAQSAMRNELGKITLDKTFEERDALNSAIVEVINGAAESWGLRALRYEIKDISPPQSIALSMEKQAAAEREKRAAVLASEGERQAVINVAEGRKQRTILESEGAALDIVNRARGEAQSILAKAEATAAGVTALSSVLIAPGGESAARLRIAEAYVQAFSSVAKASTTLLLPSHAGDPAAASALLCASPEREHLVISIDSRLTHAPAVAQALGIFNAVAGGGHSASNEKAPAKGIAAHSPAHQPEVAASSDTFSADDAPHAPTHSERAVRPRFTLQKL